MIDLSNSDFRAKFEIDKSAEKLKEYNVVSKGKTTTRIKITDSDGNVVKRGDKELLIAVHSTLSEKELKLGPIERLYMVVLKIKDADGKTVYVKANANSLKKRVGISKAIFNYIKKADSPATEHVYTSEVKQHESSGYEIKKTSTNVEQLAAKIFEHILLKEKVAHIEAIGKKGKANQKGFKLETDKSRYEGNFNARGELEGKGRYTHSEGYVYEGHFKSGKPYGKVKVTSPGGDVYQMVLSQENWQSGVGKIYYANGDFFEGEIYLHNGKLWPSNGKLTFAKGDVYEGKFILNENENLNEKFSKGKLIYKNGDVYEGDFKAGKREGNGKLIYKNGDVYEGDFKEDMRHGIGNFTTSVKELLKIDVEGLEEREIEKRKYFSKKKGTYTGPFVNDKMHGLGIVNFIAPARIPGSLRKGHFVQTTDVNFVEGVEKPAAKEPSTQ